MRKQEAMIWTANGGVHATTYGGLRDALNVEPVLLPEYRNAGYEPDDGDTLFAVDIEATARLAGCDFGWLPVNAVWSGEAAIATPDTWLPIKVERPAWAMERQR